MLCQLLVGSGWNRSWKDSHHFHFILEHSGSLKSWATVWCSYCLGLISVTVQSAESSQTHYRSLVSTLPLVQVGVIFRSLAEEALFDKTQREGTQTCLWTWLFCPIGKWWGWALGVWMSVMQAVVCACMCEREHFLLWMKSDFCLRKQAPCLRLWTLLRATNMFLCFSELTHNFIM